MHEHITDTDAYPYKHHNENLSKLHENDTDAFIRL